jgi:hypothetical protein
MHKVGIVCTEKGKEKETKTDFTVFQLTMSLLLIKAST